MSVRDELVKTNSVCNNSPDVEPLSRRDTDSPEDVNEGKPNVTSCDMLHPHAAIIAEKLSVKDV